MPGANLMLTTETCTDDLATIQIFLSIVLQQAKTTQMYNFKKTKRVHQRDHSDLDVTQSKYTSR